MAHILIDTNVLLYIYDTGSIHKRERAREIITRLEPEMVCLSAQDLAEFASVALYKLDPPMTSAQAYEQTSLLAQTWLVFNITPQIVLEAVRGVRDHKLSYYDAQVWATARLNQVPVIFSEDFQDGQILEGVRFVNPFNDEFNLDEWA